jgi:hypothetical protein
MVFIETSHFTRQVLELLPDDEYAGLQIALSSHPDAGDSISGTGGLRKLRWKRTGYRQERRRACDLLLAS